MTRSGATPPIVAPTAPTGPLVLLVDDYQDSREMYAEFLEMSGFRVLQAGDGEEAVRLAGERLPDVVLMDLSLPRLDGREATRLLKAGPATASIPVVIMSGLPSDYARVPRADAFLGKPCEPEALVAELRRLLARSGAGDSLT